MNSTSLISRHAVRTARFAAVLLVLVVAAGSVAGPARAQDGAGTYAADFLKIPVGARLMASPDAVAGMQPDASLLFSNPAFIADLSHAEAFLSTTDWLDNLVFSAVGVGVPLGRGQTVLGLGTNLLYSGGLKGYDGSLAVVSEENYYYVGFDVAMSHRFTRPRLSVAAGTTYIRQHLGAQDGNGYTFHLGAAYWIGRNLLHVAGRDLGGSMRYDSDTWAIAPEWLVGGGRVFDSRWGQFLAGAQVANSPAYGSRLQLGLDYRLNALLTLRSGVHEGLSGARPEAPFNAGFGLRYGPLNVEYAFTPQEHFSGVHTFSVAYAFGTPLRGARSAPVTVPVGHTAPPVARSEPGSSRPASTAKLQTAPAAKLPPTKVEEARPVPAAESHCLLVAGTHGRIESAQAELRALDLLKIPAKIEAQGTRYRVVVGRYTSREAAEKARRQFAGQGHAFTVVSE